MQAGPLVDQVLSRVRDPQAQLTSREFVLGRLSDAQRLVNARLGLILDEATLTTEPLRIFYPIRDLLPLATRVMFVEQAGRNLVPVPWKTFWYMARGWPRSVGGTLQLWATCGRDLLVLWPALRVATPVTVKAAKLTSTVDSDNDEMELPDDTLPMVVDLATLFVLLKARDYGPMVEVMASWKERTKLRVVTA